MRLPLQLLTPLKTLRKQEPRIAAAVRPSPVERVRAEPGPRLLPSLLTEPVALLRKAMVTAPPSVPGVVAVRVVGAGGGDKRPVPLPGVRVELRIKDETLDANTTENLGTSWLELPEGRHDAGLLVVVVGADGVVVARKAVPEGATPVLLIEVGETASIAPALMRGRQVVTRLDTIEGLGRTAVKHGEARLAALGKAIPVKAAPEKPAERTSNQPPKPRERAPK